MQIILYGFSVVILLIHLTENRLTAIIAVIREISIPILHFTDMFHFNNTAYNRKSRLRNAQKSLLGEDPKWLSIINDRNTLEDVWKTLLYQDLKVESSS